MTLQEDCNAAFREKAEHLAEEAIGWLTIHSNWPEPEEAPRFLTRFIDHFYFGGFDARAEGACDLRFREFYWRRALAEAPTESAGGERA